MICTQLSHLIFTWKVLNHSVLFSYSLVHYLVFKESYKIANLVQPHRRQMKEFKFREWRVNDGDVDIGSSFQPISLFNTSLLLSIKLNNYIIYIFVSIYLIYLWVFTCLLFYLCNNFIQGKTFHFQCLLNYIFSRKHNQEYHFWNHYLYSYPQGLSVKTI